MDRIEQSFVNKYKFMIYWNSELVILEFRKTWNLPKLANAKAALQTGIEQNNEEWPRRSL